MPTREQIKKRYERTWMSLAPYQITREVCAEVCSANERPIKSDMEFEVAIDRDIRKYEAAVIKGSMFREDIPPREQLRRRYAGKGLSHDEIDDYVDEAIEHIESQPIVSNVVLERAIDRAVRQYRDEGFPVPMREELKKRYAGYSWRQIQAEVDAGTRRSRADRLRMQLDQRKSEAPKIAETFLLFFSYAQMDTAAEATILYKDAKAKFPGKKIFRDRDTIFKLNELIHHVSAARNVVVLLSDNYPKRPFTLIELHHALKAGANVCPVFVKRQGMKSFDFAQVKLDIKSGKVRDYLDEHGWDLLKDHGMTIDDVCKDLQDVMNVAAIEFSVDQPDIVQDAMITALFQRLSL